MAQHEPIAPSEALFRNEWSGSANFGLSGQPRLSRQGLYQQHTVSGVGRPGSRTACIAMSAVDPSTCQIVISFLTSPAWRVRAATAKIAILGLKGKSGSQ
jgi:hypothetical protein